MRMQAGISDSEAMGTSVLEGTISLAKRVLFPMTTCNIQDVHQLQNTKKPITKSSRSDKGRPLNRRGKRSRNAKAKKISSCRQQTMSVLMTSTHEEIKGSSCQLIPKSRVRKRPAPSTATSSKSSDCLGGSLWNEPATTQIPRRSHRKKRMRPGRKLVAEVSSIDSLISLPMHLETIKVRGTDIPNKSICHNETKPTKPTNRPSKRPVCQLGDSLGQMGEQRQHQTKQNQSREKLLQCKSDHPNPAFHTKCGKQHSTESVSDVLGRLKTSSSVLEISMVSEQKLDSTGARLHGENDNATDGRQSEEKTRSPLFSKGHINAEDEVQDDESNLGLDGLHRHATHSPHRVELVNAFHRVAEDNAEQIAAVMSVSVEKVAEVCDNEAGETPESMVEVADTLQTQPKESSPNHSGRRRRRSIPRSCKISCEKREQEADRSVRRMTRSQSKKNCRKAQDDDKTRAVAQYEEERGASSMTNRRGGDEEECREGVEHTSDGIEKSRSKSPTNDIRHCKSSRSCISHDANAPDSDLSSSLCIEDDSSRKERKACGSEEGSPSVDIVDSKKNMAYSSSHDVSHDSQNHIAVDYASDAPVNDKEILGDENQPCPNTQLISRNEKDGLNGSVQNFCHAGLVEREDRITGAQCSTTNHPDLVESVSVDEDSPQKSTPQSKDLKDVENSDAHKQIDATIDSCTPSLRSCDTDDANANDGSEYYRESDASQSAPHSDDNVETKPELMESPRILELEVHSHGGSISSSGDAVASGTPTCQRQNLEENLKAHADHAKKESLYHVDRSPNPCQMRSYAMQSPALSDDENDESSGARRESMVFHLECVDSFEVHDSNDERETSTNGSILEVIPALNTSREKSAEDAGGHQAIDHHEVQPMQNGIPPAASPEQKNRRRSTRLNYANNLKLHPQSMQEDEKSDFGESSGEHSNTTGNERTNEATTDSQPFYESPSIAARVNDQEEGRQSGSGQQCRKDTDGESNTVNEECTESGVDIEEHGCDAYHLMEDDSPIARRVSRRRKSLTEDVNYSENDESETGSASSSARGRKRKTGPLRRKLGRPRQVKRRRSCRIKRKLAENQSAVAKNNITSRMWRATSAAASKNGAYGISLHRKEKKEKKEKPRNSTGMDSPCEQDKTKQSVSNIKTQNACWSRPQLGQLKRAVSGADTSSASFWENVSDKIEGKSAQECRDQWFANLATPKARNKRRKSCAKVTFGKLPKNATASSTTSASRKKNRNKKETFHGGEDDIFDSTPMREALRSTSNKSIGAGCYYNKLLSNFDSPIEHSPATTQAEESSDDADLTPLRPSPLKIRKGYKGYINALARGRKAAQKAKKKKRRSSVNQKRQKGAGSHTLSARSKDDGVEMDVRLSPGGTVEIQGPSDDEMEEMLHFQDENYEQEEAF